MATRPKKRPQTDLTPSDMDMIERLVWAEAGTEGVEGRNAVRSTILNRLKSERFPDTVLGVIHDKGQFEPIKKWGTVHSIPVPDDALEQGKAELADYLMLGEDATGGRTLFQNEKITKERGTEFEGTDNLTVGDHTFSRGIKGQEEVLDTNFSHNVKLKPDGKPYRAKGGLMSETDKNYGHGGYVSATGLMGAPQYVVGIDEESGNEIPYGATAENVADTIDAKLSEGEFVIPADVVRWYGVQHFLDMIDFAKMQFMAMAMEEEMPEIEVEELEIEDEDELEEDKPKKKGSYSVKNTPKTVFLR